MWNPIRARRLIEERGRTRKWLAEKVGIEEASLGNILRGREPSRPVLILMAQALETTTDYLLGSAQSRTGT